MSEKMTRTRYICERSHGGIPANMRAKDNWWNGISGQIVLADTCIATGLIDHIQNAFHVGQLFTLLPYFKSFSMEKR